MCEIYFIASQQGLFFVEAPGPRKYYSRLMSDVSGMTEPWLSDCLSLSISSHSAKYFLPAISEGAAAAESVGVRLIIEFVAAWRSEKRCSNPSAANQMERIQISTNQMSAQSSALLSVACGSLRNKQIYPWERPSFVRISNENFKLKQFYSGL